MVGLPYPNIKSPELAEKMQYLNSTLASDLHVLVSPVHGPTVYSLYES